MLSEVGLQAISAWPTVIRGIHQARLAVSQRLRLLRSTRLAREACPGSHRGVTGTSQLGWPLAFLPVGSRSVFAKPWGHECATIIAFMLLVTRVCALGRLPMFRVLRWPRSRFSALQKQTRLLQSLHSKRLCSRLPHLRCLALPHLSISARQARKCPRVSVPRLCWPLASTTADPALC